MNNKVKCSKSQYCTVLNCFHKNWHDWDKTFCSTERCTIKNRKQYKVKCVSDFELKMTEKIDETENKNFHFHGCNAKLVYVKWRK